MIKVNVWNPHGGNVGHASAEISTNEYSAYVSWWPAGSDWHSFRPGETNTYEQDVAAEGGEPTQTRRIHGLDERAAIIWWTNMTGIQSSEYQSMSLNCAWAVISALKAGGADSFISWTRLTDQFNFPLASMVPAATLYHLAGAIFNSSTTNSMDVVDNLTQIWTPADCIRYADAVIEGLSNRT